MKFSENWLKEWVDPQLGTDQLVAQLTMLGLEVDDVESAAGEFSGVVVAEIVACEKHPDADKLKVCEVNAGDETLQIVCGAPNARAGLKTALSKIGAVLPGNFKIKKSKLRGVESQGMLCSEVELGISEESDGIIELPADAPVGSDVREYLDLEDQLIDVDLTPNRADCFCMRGVAREVATMNDLVMMEPNVETIPATHDEVMTVNLQATAQCPKYGSRVIKGINNTQDTPGWMKEKLRRSGIRSIHPVVDVTNYVMLELGQPMHAFDQQQIHGQIVVRMANDEEKITLLDESEANLNAEFLLIADEQQALAVAGVMGGLNSGVTAQTQDIVLESAYFDPATIMGKSRKLGVHTESGLRFERGVDWQLQEVALERATALILEICGGEPGPVHVVTEPTGLPVQQVINLSRAQLQRVLGFAVADEQVTRIFTALGFVTEFDGETWTVTSPSWRFDMAISEDLIEEVVRVVGYDAMPSHRLHSSDAIRVIPEALRKDHAIKSQLCDLGFQEVINYAFVAEKQLAAVGMAEHAFALANPLNHDMAVMRTGLLAGVLSNIKSNLARQHHDLSLFEMGKVFSLNQQIEQTDQLLLAKTGLAHPEQWSCDSRKVDFFDLKGVVTELLTGISGEVSLSESGHEFLHPGRQAAVRLNDDVIGYLGQVHPSILQKMKIKQEVYVAELNVAGISQLGIPHWQEVSKFPKVRRDLSIKLRQDISWQQVKAVVYQSVNEGGDSLIDLSLFDVYTGEHIEKGYKSLAMAMIFQEKNRTLEDKEVDKLVSKAVSFLAEQFNAEVRT
ncbi:phenylalanine--tRNA ligase subunit beta [Marinicella sediminis]|uniref:Phenylalanine--tRNA ligase beta subunit n=1 Tax=Marinicella sediminis TaxID=1792834 RepID=A0ABV7JG08_9GAMM|nr:phenylalanine--tRNA ligase subunit beta [Marinicella sediminis]